MGGEIAYPLDHNATKCDTHSTLECSITNTGDYSSIGGLVIRQIRCGICTKNQRYRIEKLIAKQSTIITKVV